MKERPKALIVGITGGIATGKSTLLGMFRASGVPVIDSDRIVHRLLRRGTKVYSDVMAVFGEAYLNSRGEIDRRKLGRHVFRNRLARRKLERIVHPEVFSEIARKVGSYRRRGCRVVAVDIPLLFETGAISGVDVIVVAYAPRSAQIERLMRRGHTRQEALARIKAQWDIETKRRRADAVFEMTKPFSRTQREVRAWLRKMK